MKKILTLCLFLAGFIFSHAQLLESPASNGELTGNAETDGLSTATQTFFDNDGQIFEHADGKLLFKGDVRNRKLHGNWRSWYNNGLLCDSGTFVKGLPDGEWRHWDASGQLVALRTYSADKYNRIENELIRYNPRMVTYPLVTIYQKNKHVALRYMRSSYSFGSPANEKREMSLSQKAKANITSGNRYHPVFDHSLHHGLYVNYFRNGIAKDSGFYKNGLRHGVWIHRDSEDGAFQRGAYENGTKVKGWRTYNQDGKLVSLVYYARNGNIRWQKSF